MGQSRKQNVKLLKRFTMSDGEWVHFVFRYMVGRMTITACVFARELAEAWPYMCAAQQTMIASELDTLFELDDKARASGAGVYPLGHDMDRANWELVRAAYRRPDTSRSD